MSVEIKAEATQQPVAEPAVDAPTPTSKPAAGAALSMRSMRTYIAYAVLLSGLLTSVMLGAYYWYFHVHHKTGAIATVDLSEVVKIYELQFTSLLARPNVTDKERQDAYNIVSQVGPNIEKAINALQQQCGCTVLVKSAVLAGSTTDMTDDLKKLLGLEGMSSRGMVQPMPQSQLFAPNGTGSKP
jgi:hypothetical protein